MNQPASTALPTRFQCRHVFTDGRRCGSVCLRGEELCYYHHTSRAPVENPRSRRSRRSTFDLPLLEDRSSIQAAINEVLRRIARNDLDSRRAGLLLYGLQTASINLPPTPRLTAKADARPAASPDLVEEVITDPALGTLAPRLQISDLDAQHRSFFSNLLYEFLHGKADTPPTPAPDPAPAASPQAAPPQPEPASQPQAPQATSEAPGILPAIRA